MRALLESRVAIVTGGASGIRREIGETLAREGARVVLADKDGDAAARSAAALASAGLAARGAACDVTREADIERTLAEALSREGRLDVLVNNAGLQHVAPIEEFP